MAQPIFFTQYFLSRSSFTLYFDSLALFHSCNCAMCLLNSAVLVCMHCFHHGILVLFPSLLLVFSNNSATAFTPTKIGKFVSKTVLYGSNLKIDLLPVFFLSPFLSTVIIIRLVNKSEVAIRASYNLHTQKNSESSNPSILKFY